MNILDLYLHNSTGKLCRVRAFSWRWWILTALIGVCSVALSWGALVLLSLAFGY